jgi:hypothetical protein
MRIPKTWVPVIAKNIINNIERKNLAQLRCSKEEAIAEAERLLMEELTVEDRLNDEVRELLKRYETEIERGKVDYRKLFDMTKAKLVRERNIIL